MRTGVLSSPLFPFFFKKCSTNFLFLTWQPIGLRSSGALTSDDYSPVPLFLFFLGSSAKANVLKPRLIQVGTKACFFNVTSLLPDAFYFFASFFTSCFSLRFPHECASLKCIALAFPHFFPHPIRSFPDASKWRQHSPIFFLPRFFLSFSVSLYQITRAR